MKVIVIVTFMFFFSITAFCQTNIEEDTSRANLYLRTSLSLEIEPEEKLNLLNKALKLYQIYPFQEKQIEIYSHLAYAYYLNEEDSLSIVYAEKAINLSVTHLTTELHPHLLFAYKTLLFFYNVKNSNLAIEYGEKALLLVKKPSEEYFDLLLYLISDYTYSNNIESINQKADEIEKIITSDTVWQTKLPILYRTKMQINYLSANYENAINYGKQCIIENKKYPIYNNISIGPICIEIANYYAFLGKHEEAIEWMKDGIEISNPLEGSIKWASYQANLSTIYGLNKTTKDKAISYGLTAIKVFNEDKVSNSGYLQILHYNISNYYFQLEDYPNAMSHIKKSMSYGDNPHVKIHYASVLASSNEYEKALEVIQELLIAFSEIFEDKHIYKNPSKYENFNDLNFIARLSYYKSSYLIRKGIKENNLEDIKQGVLTGDLAEYHYQNILEKMKGFQEARLSISKSITEISNYKLKGLFELYEAKQNVTSEDLFNIIEKRKSLFLLETLTPSMLPDSIVSIEKGLVDKKRGYEQKLALTTKDSTDFYQNALFSTNIALEKLIATVRTDYPKESDNFHYLQYAKIADIQKTLDTKTIIVEYSKIQSKYIYIQVVSKNDLKIIHVPTSALDEKIKELNQLLQSPFLIQQTNREKLIQLSSELYQVLIEPIINELGDKKKLIIIPEGELFYLPFEVLLASDEIKPFHELDFLIKGFDISYQYSATIYRQLKNKPSIKNNSFLGFAPVFKNGQTIDIANRSAEFIVDSLYRSIEDNKFIGLPNSKIEVETIAKNITEKGGNVNILMEEAATKQALMIDLKNQSYQFVHIATHGIVNFQNAKLSALVCSDNTNKGENSLFFANEIQMQDIQADLVVLSSCESGIGQLIVGEGLLALNRSFIYAGANNVLFSLWKVNDEYTSELMIDFYESYFETQSYSAALRQAKLKMLENPITANPRYWAAFVLIGE